MGSGGGGGLLLGHAALGIQHVLLACHGSDTALQGGSHAPGIWKSAKKQHTEARREVGMCSRQFLSICGKAASSGKNKNLTATYQSFFAKVHSESQPANRIYKQGWTVTDFEVGVPTTQPPYSTDEEPPLWEGHVVRERQHRHPV